jgi:leader peptidase (prepilin peptidase) / N-methyltransferase
VRAGITHGFRGFSDSMDISLLFTYASVALFGLIFGSFLNVCIARLPQGLSIVSPRSRCPRCGHPIRWFDNIPVVSYLFLGGRCRDCRAGISPIYPLVEILSAGIWVAAFSRAFLSPEFVKIIALDMLALIVVFTDLLERRVPHAITLFGIGAGLLLSFLVPVDSRPVEWFLRHAGIFVAGTSASVVGAVAGALAGGGLFYAVGEAFYLASGRKKEYLGFGDVMLMLMVGTFLGPALTLMTILIGSLAGTLIAVPLTIAHPRFRDYEWPYATFLGSAAIVASLWGSILLEAYLRWAGLA